MNLYICYHWNVVAKIKGRRRIVRNNTYRVLSTDKEGGVEFATKLLLKKKKHFLMEIVSITAVGIAFAFDRDKVEVECFEREELDAMWLTDKNNPNRS